MNEIAEKDVLNIENMIYEIDGKEVMLDSDLANLYHVETKRVNEAVKNNPNKFTERDLFRISDIEYNSLESKISTSKGGSRKGHTAFTEQGVYMLATVLESKASKEVNTNIMRAFEYMRNYKILEEKIDSNTRKINELFDRLNSKEITKK